MTVASAANCKIDHNAFGKDEVVDMYTVFEETREEGRSEGKMEGRLEGRAEEIIEMGYEFGLSENEILDRLQNKLDMPLQKARVYLQMFGRRTVQ